MRPLKITLNCNIGALTIPGLAFLIALFFGVYEAADMRKRTGEPAAQQTGETAQDQESGTTKADQQAGGQTTATDSK